MRIESELMTFLDETLAEAGAGAHILSASVVSRPGIAPVSSWRPASAEPPAFLIYSLTKTITAAIVLKLAEDGKLALDETLSNWLPQVRCADRIFIRQLLNHTAGIPDYGGISAYHDQVRSSPSAPWSFERFASETYEKGLLFEPGKGWEYSNPGYMLLKLLIETVTGSTYGTTVRERLAEPLGLDHTRAIETLDEMKALAPAMSALISAGGSPRDVRELYHPGWVSHGVIASTTPDIARLFDSLFGGRYLSLNSLAEMSKLVPVGKDAAADPSPLRYRNPGYGLGLMGDRNSPWGFLRGHNGGGPGYTASAFHAGGSGASVCVMGAIEGKPDTQTLVARILDYCEQIT